MKKTLVLFSLVLMVLLFARSSATASDWRFGVGLTYMSGFMEVADIYSDNIEWESGLDPDLWNIPVGLTFQTCFEFTHGSRIGMELGPICMITVIEIGGDDDTWWYYEVPVGVSYGFTFIPSSGISPYAKVGVKHHFAGGDYVVSSAPGFTGAVGVEFGRKNAIGLDLEIGYDTSLVTLEDRWMGTEEEIQSGGLTASIRAVF